MLVVLATRPKRSLATSHTRLREYRFGKTSCDAFPYADNKLNSYAYSTNERVEHHPEEGDGEEASDQSKAATRFDQGRIRVLERFDGRRRHGDPLRS